MAAAARAMLAAKTAGRSLPSSSMGFLSDVASRAAAARAALEKAKRALLLKKEQMAAFMAVKVSVLDATRKC